jgi:hypothetical protein
MNDNSSSVNLKKGGSKKRRGLDSLNPLRSSQQTNSTSEHSKNGLNERKRLQNIKHLAKEESKSIPRVGRNHTF